MFDLMMIGTAVSIMCFAANSEGRSEIIWGCITFALCLLCVFVIPIPYFDIIIGLAISFIAMFIMNIISPRPPGVI